MQTLKDFLLETRGFLIYSPGAKAWYIEKNGKPALTKSRHSAKKFMDNASAQEALSRIKKLGATDAEVQRLNQQGFRGAMAESFAQEIVSVEDRPIKSTSSSGAWAVPIEVSVPFGSGKTPSYQYFFKKTEAVKWIENVKKRLAKGESIPTKDTMHR